MARDLTTVAGARRPRKSGRVLSICLNFLCFTGPMKPRYAIHLLDLPAPRLTWQGAMTIAVTAALIWTVAVVVVRLMLAVT